MRTQTHRFTASTYVVLLATAIFLVRGLFYCAFVPSWEGYDEWAHFAYVDEIVRESHPLIDRNHPVSGEIGKSMELAPAPWGTGKPYTNEDDFWKLAANERANRASALRSLHGDEPVSSRPGWPTAYEALQPPLYYRIASCVYRAAAGWNILNRLFALRVFSLVIASGCLPVIYLLLMRIVDNVSLAPISLVFVVVLPELMIDVCRVGNECLGIVLFSWLTYLLVESWRGERTRMPILIWTGVALGLGLLTKAYFVTAIPAVIATSLLRVLLRRRWRGELLHLIAVLSIAFAIAGWWYVRNRVLTGSWTGLLETVQLAHTSIGDYLSAIRRVDWRNAFDSILTSHIWFGSWSGLTVRSWMYHLIFALLLASCVGVALRMTRKASATLIPPTAIYVFFWIGQAYNVLLLFLTKGASTSMGWYLYAVVAAEIVLLTIGISQLFQRAASVALASLVLVIGALDVYTVCFVSIPYFVGLTSHTAKGVSAFHFAAFKTVGPMEIFQRLSLLKPIWLGPGTLATMFAAYLFCTLAAIGVAWLWALRPSSMRSIQQASAE